MYIIGAGGGGRTHTMFSHQGILDPTTGWS